MEDFIITKSIKENYKTQNLPHVAVAKKMRERGKYVVAGTRIPYVFIEYTEVKNAPQYLRAEDPDYCRENEVQIDYQYYLEKQFVTPIDEVLFVKFGVNNVLKNLNSLLKKQEIRDTKGIIKYFTPTFQVVE